MIFLIVFLGFMLWCIPGAVVAKSLYANKLREINARPVVVVPEKPARPQIKLGEVLHDTMPRKCAMLIKDSAGGRKYNACTCTSRDEWVDVRNAWLDYEEWISEYGSIKNGVLKKPTVNMFPILLSIPAWPVGLAVLYIKSGHRIPDYSEIARFEEEEFKRLEGK